MGLVGGLWIGESDGEGSIGSGEGGDSVAKGFDVCEWALPAIADAWAILYVIPPLPKQTRQVHLIVLGEGSSPGDP